MSESSFVREKRSENQLSGEFWGNARVAANEFFEREGPRALSNIAGQSSEEFAEDKEKWSWAMKGGTALVGVGIVWGITELLT